MTDQNLASWARGLAGAQTRDGFLRLSADQPLQLAKAGEHAGPELLFSDRRQMVSFFVGDCEPDPKDDGKMVASAERLAQRRSGLPVAASSINPCGSMSRVKTRPLPAGSSTA